jgi:hypothetical protein
MLTRTRHASIASRHRFGLTGHEGLQPAGACVVETGKALLEGLSFTASPRGSATVMRRPPQAGAVVQALPVDPQDLAEAQAAGRP